MMRAKAKIKFPVATLNNYCDRITIKNLDARQLYDFYIDVEQSVNNALKRFSNNDEVNCYYFMRELYKNLGAKIESRCKPYYLIHFPLPTAIYVVKHFAHHSASVSTVEIYSMLHQKLPPFYAKN